MAILTRETAGTGVTNNGAPLTNAQLDNNFIELVASLADKQPLDADLTAIAGLTGTSGFLKKTASNTWSLDTTSYLPLSGGTITGTVTFGQSGKIAFPDITTIPDTPTNEQYDYITFGTQGSISQVSGRGALMITSSDDALVLANGDVGKNFTSSNITVSTESIYMLSDFDVKIITGLQEGFGGGVTYTPKTTTIGTDGTITSSDHGSSSNWKEAYDNYITSIAVSGTSTKTITLTQRDGGTITADFTDIDTDTVPNNATITISAGTALSTGGDFTTNQASNETITLNHANITTTPTTGTATTLTHEGTFAAITGVTVNAQGHTTDVETTTFTMPAGAVPNNATITISAGTDLITGGDFTTDQATDETITINHANITRTDTTSNTSPGYGGTFTAVDSVTTNARGHLTAINVKTVTIPASDNTNTTYALTAAQTGGNNTNPNLFLNASSGTDYNVQLVGSGATTVTRNSDGQITIASTDTNTNQLTTFVVEDGDGTEVTISHGKEWKFVEGSGIDINWTDTSTGSDADPFDLTIGIKGNEIPGSVDLNTYRTTGFYAQNANADALSGSNYPADQAGILQVINDDYGNGLHTTQLYSQYNSTNYWHRTYYNGGWTSWRNLAQDNNTIPNDATITISAGTDLTTGGAFTTDQASDETITINHANISRTDTTSTASPAHGATFTAVDSVTTNARGHLTAINVKTVTLPSDNNTDTLQSIANDTTNADRYITFVNSASGAQTGGSNSNLRFNPSTGLLSATSKSFDIEHPTKEGMRLRYGSLEGPEQGVYVRGRLVDSNTIELPDYWTGLVDRESITVHLTSCKIFQKLSVYSVQDNSITIKNHSLFSSNTDCFYIVYAERKDIAKLEVEYYR
jgi:hypothetical protein